MKIATWNVNSVRARLDNITAWIQAEKPDVLLLQEIKCEAHAFPQEAFHEYNIALCGQKSYNGVAILSRFPLEDIIEGLSTLGENPEARYIEALINSPMGVVRIASVYVPNGGNLGADKYISKLKFLDHLRMRLAQLLTFDELTIIGGDYNITPTDDDVHDPAAWHEKILCSTPERLALHAIFYLGYYDALRIQHPEGVAPFTWWDYRTNAWPQDAGLRIDHLLLSPLAADRIKKAGVDRKARGQEKASDHAPVWVSLEKKQDLWS